MGFESLPGGDIIEDITEMSVSEEAQTILDEASEKRSAEEVMVHLQTKENLAVLDEEIGGMMGLGARAQVLFYLIENTELQFISAYFWKILFWNMEEDWEGDEDGLDPVDTSDTRVCPADSEVARNVSDGGAISALEAAKERYPDMMSYIDEGIAHYEEKTGVRLPRYIALAIGKIESGFQAGIQNSQGTDCVGYGQFYDQTWEDEGGFWDKNPEFSGVPRENLRANIFATIWYALENADVLGIDVNGPNAMSLLYDAHHCGAEGCRELWRFREEIKDGSYNESDYRIPGGYIGSSAYAEYPGVDGEMDTYQEYANFMSYMSSKAQAVADAYKNM